MKYQISHPISSNTSPKVKPLNEIQNEELFKSHPKVKVNNEPEKNPTYVFKTSPKPPSSESSLPNHQDEEEKVVDSEWIDSNGNVIGPFTILRKQEPTKFSTRQDVVNKTLIRSLKKYYTQQFKSSLGPRGGKHLNGSDNVDKFIKNHIKLISDKRDPSKKYISLVNPKSKFCISQGNLSETEVQDLFYKIKKLIKVIIQKPEKDFEPMMRLSPTDAENAKTHPTVVIIERETSHKFQRMCKAFYECLYNYSHKKLEVLIEYQEFCILFADFYQSQKFEHIKNRDNTMSKNKEVYEKAANGLVYTIMSLLAPQTS